MNDERKYLESLLKDRFNFFLVFTSLIIAGIASADLANPRLEQLAYLASLTISLFLWLALLRTNSLVNRALDRLSDDEPYKKLVIGEKWPFSIRANTYVIWIVPLVIILTFGALFRGSVHDYGLYPPSTLPGTECIGGSEKVDSDDA